MLDDLRKDDETLDFLDEIVAERDVDFTPPPARLFGLTPAQRFIISVMLFIVVVVVGIMALIAFGKIDLPFL